jgi:protocatechuate 3,4-dioxygenase beta subunit
MEAIMTDDFTLSRRRLLGMSIAAGAAYLLIPVDTVFGRPADGVPTPEQGRGPFYPDVLPADMDGDLTVIKGKAGKAQGQVVYVLGRVLDLEGRPIPGVRVEIWQANTFGRYTHPNDRNPAPLDPNFEGYGQVVTDLEGRYRFKTIKPASYPTGAGWVRPPHIHFQVTTGTKRLVTQMYFPGEPLNENDSLLERAPNKEPLIAKLTAPTGDLEPDALVATWNIVLPR